MNRPRLFSDSRLACALLAAGVAWGSNLAQAQNSTPPAWNPAVPLPQFITHFVIDPKYLVAISKYRSNAGHGYSDQYEWPDSSMKNYYQPLPQYLFGLNGQNTLPEYAPTSGTISTVTPDGPLSTGEPRGNQVSIVPDGYPAFAITLFHCDTLPNIAPGLHVNAGDQVGFADLREAINIDVAASAYWNATPMFSSPGVLPSPGQVLKPPGWRLLSFFDLMTDQAFAAFAPYGFTDRSAAIVPLAYRNQYPAQFAQWDPANLDPIEAIIFPIAPIIDTQPLSCYLTVNDAALFYVEAAITGTLPTYQWYKNGIAIPGATTEDLQIGAVQATDAGYYSVVLSAPGGSTSSYSALLTMASPNNAYSGDPELSRLVNLSAQAPVSASSPLTAGFVIGGSGSKQLLLRGVGPSLTNYGVGGALPDATLAVTPAGAAAPVLSNSRWAATAGLTSTTTAVGAFPLVSGSADAAAVTGLAAGTYTMSVAPSQAADSGLAMAEVYDADLDPVHAPSRLMNLSALTASNGSNPGITAGFVILGPCEKQVLIRAVGPGLAQFGVPSPMPDPQLKVFPQASSVPPLYNGTWGDNGQAAVLQGVFAQAGAFPLTIGSNDAAMSVYLPPGSYTVQASSAGGNAGNVLLEIYDLDPLEF
jgi:hypothetical protein